mmetsp:Transcript_4608/g.11168  ORF Transcript_4608/g.11168 Transcript_4608/m.11168 type:complete len:244 (+) Transcript_4608:445-1176(+)
MPCYSSTRRGSPWSASASPPRGTRRGTAPQSFSWGTRWEASSPALPRSGWPWPAPATRPSSRSSRSRPPTRGLRCRFRDPWRASTRRSRGSRKGPPWCLWRGAAATSSCRTGLQTSRASAAVPRSVTRCSPLCRAFGPRRSTTLSPGATSLSGASPEPSAGQLLPRSRGRPRPFSAGDCSACGLPRLSPSADAVPPLPRERSHKQRSLCPRASPSSRRTARQYRELSTRKMVTRLLLGMSRRG